MSMFSISLVFLFITYKHHGLIVILKKENTHLNGCDLLNECKIKNKLVLGFCD